MEVRPVRAGEGLRLRALRLRALADAPDAFGSTYAEAAAYPEAYWHNRAAQSEVGDRLTTFVAVAGDSWRGMAAGSLPPEEPRTAELISMWVAPEARGAGVGQALVEAVSAWARGLGMRRLHLWVVTTNEPAVTLYTRSGFRPTGATQPYPNHDGLREMQMERAL